jgi:hypothetical protein
VIEEVLNQYKQTRLQVCNRYQRQFASSLGSRSRVTEGDVVGARKESCGKLVTGKEAEEVNTSALDA